MQMFNLPYAAFIFPIKVIFMSYGLNPGLKRSCPQKATIALAFLCETLWVTWRNSVFQFFTSLHRVARSENTENHRVFGQPPAKVKKGASFF